MSARPNAVALICDLHKKDGGPPVGKLPGLWHRKVDRRWSIWVNGHMEPMKMDGRIAIAPGDCYVEFNGWPAGSFSMIHGEGVLAAGAAANYETFCAALKNAIAETKAVSQ